MKIAVIEDNINDIMDIYSIIKDPKYGLYICFVAPEGVKDKNAEVIFSATLGYLRQKGFDTNRIYKGFNDSLIDSDLFFIDGLDGRVLEVIQKNKLPKDRLYVSTSNESLRQDCGRAGYQTIIKTARSVQRLADKLF